MGIIQSLKQLFHKPTNNLVTVYSPFSGYAKNIREVADVVFSDLLVGDGVAIVPMDDVVCSPCKGLISKMYATGHAILVTHHSGVEIFIHVGFNSANLRESNFTPLVNEQDVVTVGQPLIKVNLC
ncbi:PTS sugar transporter subunit IIA [Psittacicella hinzii]|uniref:PTS system glucose-specific EIIA component n=1 Tax=Psittacicella hinzii TaxID=2028575 RepID=A0A3A1YFA4_9GAMM|nr:glucose PTS transporter subunit IIA [Psittacicella hinzii]RIY35858.1 hypothetical protein CKF58_06435 [Psittacicella hinzii]